MADGKEVITAEAHPGASPPPLSLETADTCEKVRGLLRILDGDKVRPPTDLTEFVRFFESGHPVLARQTYGPHTVETRFTGFVCPGNWPEPAFTTLHTGPGGLLETYHWKDHLEARQSHDALCKRIEGVWVRGEKL